MKLVMLKLGHRYSNRCPAFYELREGASCASLTEAEGIIVLALLGRPYLTRMDMIEVMWLSADDMPDFWHGSFQLRLWRLGRKLALFGHRIARHQGAYCLEETVPERMAA